MPWHIDALDMEENEIKIVNRTERTTMKVRKPTEQCINYMTEINQYWYSLFDQYLSFWIRLDTDLCITEFNRI